MADKPDVYKYLEERGVEEDNINRMKDEKIDADTIEFMDDDLLKTFVPLLGDRLALRGFCRKAIRPAPQEQQSKKHKLIDKLRNKLKLKRHRQTSDSDSDGDDMGHSSTRSDNRSANLFGNRNAQKDTRKIDIGWIDYSRETDTYKQVRKHNGGGTRQLSVSKKACKDDILKLAQGLFFKDGQSSRGKLEEFEFELCDFRKLPVSADITVGSLYDQLRMPVLRFYMQTKQKSKDERETVQVEEEDDDSQLPWWDVGNEEVVVDDLDITGGAAAQPDTPTIQFGPENCNEQQQLDDTLPIADPVYEGQVTDHVNTARCEIVVLRRGAIIDDMISAFCNPNIVSSRLSVHMILPNGDMESGQGSGVFQDALTQFWSEFGDKMTTGTVLKVPVLRHDFCEREWEAVGRIIAKGWKDLQYFPVSLAPVFMETALYGSSTADTKEAFLRFIPESEREVIELALREFPSDTDELLDILGGYECHKLPREENLARLLAEIGHKEMIQKPMFIADCMRQELKAVFAHLSRQEFLSLYDELRPTAKKVLTKLKFPEQSTPQQGMVTSYLKRYIRSLDDKLLGKFLRFCTGSDIMQAEAITIDFSSLEGFQRRPVGHTCGRVLEIPSTYDSFVELKQEFTEILESGVWVMDIL